MSAPSIPNKFLVAFSFAGEQRELVRSIAEAVEKRLGKETVFFDEWYEHHLAGDDADLKLQEIYGKKCALVVVCVSECYGGKPWTKVEHRAIRARRMQSDGSPDVRDRYSVLPIRVGDGEVPGIPFNTIVPDVRGRSAEEASQLIIDRLLLVVPGLEIEPDEPSADPSWPESPPELIWPMADHAGVREVFATLLTRDAPWRYLPVRGPTETGKSLITRRMMHNAVWMPDIACGRFDFKGSINMDDELRVFVQYLDVPIPPPSASINDRLGKILDALVQRKRPALLIFDTYEAAGRPQRGWVEEELLIRLIRAPWLRVVIAGQRVPESVGAIWGPVAHTVIDLKPPPPGEWFEYGKQHRPDLKLEEVEIACRLAQNKASLLSQLLCQAT